MQEAIEALLPPNYYADSEQSLQVSGFDRDLWIEHSIQPDISIFQVEDVPSKASPGIATAPTLELPLWETISDDEDFLKAVVIYRIEGDQEREVPVARIELISPSNKPPHSYYRQYMINRVETLRADVVLIEIDYIHERRPLLPGLPSYSAGDSLAFPYMVLVNNPHAAEDEKGFQQYGINVLGELPKIRVPLLDKDEIVLDLGMVYRRTFESRRRYQLRVDYALDPPGFARYRADDREAIRAFLAGICEQQHGEEG